MMCVGGYVFNFFFGIFYYWKSGNFGSYKDIWERNDSFLIVFKVIWIKSSIFDSRMFIKGYGR